MLPALPLAVRNLRTLDTSLDQGRLHIVGEKNVSVARCKVLTYFAAPA